MVFTILACFATNRKNEEKTRASTFRRFIQRARNSPTNIYETLAWPGSIAIYLCRGCCSCPHFLLFVLLLLLPLFLICIYLKKQKKLFSFFFGTRHIADKWNAAASVTSFFFLEAFCDISHRLGGITPFGVFSDAFPGLKMWVTFACATANF
jgi:hypothetical protein